MAALTFDDGPSRTHTLGILEVLSRHDMRATFFVLAKRAQRHPDLLAAMRDAGHEVALHGDDHASLVGCSTRQKIDEVRGGKKRLEAELGRPVRFSRPAYGVQDVRAFLVARTAGLEVIGWTAVGKDWEDITPAEVADNADAGLRPGAIVLLHERCEPAPGEDDSPSPNLDRVEMTEQVIARAEVRGLQLVSVGTLLEAGIPDRAPWFWRSVEPASAM